jgi:hypothetical protein
LPQVWVKVKFLKSLGQRQMLASTLLISYSFAMGAHFPTQVPNLSPNRHAKGHFGKVGVGSGA